ncbi:MAG: D-alanyl-D-alanine carboxypeptidase family protein [Cyanobacteria bacterium J06598_1]
MSSEILNGRFEIEKPLSCSGSCTVYLACDRKQLHRPACTVTAMAYRQSGMRDRLQQQAQILERLSQAPQIPRVISHFSQQADSQTAEANAISENKNETQPPPSQARHISAPPSDVFYIVQEHITGHPISQELTPDKKLSESYVAKLLQDVLVALANVHRQRQVHQNLHPQSLIRQAFDGQIFLTQFGALSRLSRSEIGPDGSLHITEPVSPHPYLAPEQLQPNYTEKPLPASDLYSLGLIAIEALTGAPHYNLTYDPNRGLLWREGIEVSLPLAEFIDRLVRHNSRDRFIDATEALDTLRVERERHKVAHNSRFATVVVSPGGRALPSTTQRKAHRSSSGRALSSSSAFSTPSPTHSPKPLNPHLFKFFAGSLAVLMALGIGVKAYQWGQYRLTQLPETWPETWEEWRGTERKDSDSRETAASPSELTPLLQDGSILLRPAAASAFWAMVAAAKTDDIELYAIGGYQPAGKVAQPTAKDDYPTGYAIAIGSADAAQDWQPSFARSEAFQWLDTHAKDYGFELSIQEKGLIKTTSPEPWHWRYAKASSS